MKLTKLFGILGALALFSFFVGCEDDTTTIGSDIATGEVEINIDTLYFNLKAQPVKIESFDSKTGNLMVGNIQSEKYGRLSCSFVTRLMCSADLGVADSLFFPERVDSCKLILGASRNGIVGDSLAPQRLTVYKLIKQLDSKTINNTFNPDGYYDPADPFASKSYTVSEIAGTDSAFYNNTYVDITLSLPVEFGREIFEAYKNEPQIFQWPSVMAKEFLPGIFVEPTFGNGCIANIESVYVGVFYHSLSETTSIEDGDTTVSVTHVNHLAVPFTVSPEVLSSNTVKYEPSSFIKEWNNGENDAVIITTPGGYIASFDFPVQTIIDRYKRNNVHLSTVNDLMLYIPAEAADPDLDMEIAQNILLIKKSEYDSFFKENKVPDNLTSFTGVYDSNNERYYFSSLRNYFLNLLNKDTITTEDTEFILVPIEIETETVSSYYGDGSTYVTKCVPYISRPTMTLLKADESMVIFSYSSQMID